MYKHIYMNFTEVGEIQANWLVQVPAFGTFLASVCTFLTEVKRKFCPHTYTDFSNNSQERDQTISREQVKISFSLIRQKSPKDSLWGTFCDWPTASDQRPLRTACLQDGAAPGQLLRQQTQPHHSSPASFPRGVPAQKRGRQPGVRQFCSSGTALQVPHRALDPATIVYREGKAH